MQFPARLTTDELESRSGHGSLNPPRARASRKTRPVGITGKGRPTRPGPGDGCIHVTGAAGCHARTRSSPTAATLATAGCWQDSPGSFCFWTPLSDADDQSHASRAEPSGGGWEPAMRSSIRRSLAPGVGDNAVITTFLPAAMLRPPARPCLAPPLEAGPSQHPSRVPVPRAACRVPGRFHSCQVSVPDVTNELRSTPALRRTPSSRVHLAALP